MTSEKLISIKEVACRYRYRSKGFSFETHEALRDISLDIYRGETLGIIGRNGVGKSTLLRLIAGILLPDAGAIVRHREISVSLLTLQLGFYPELTGHDNAILGAMLLGHSKKQALLMIDKIKSFSELGHWFEEPLKSYSSGMKARLGFAVAMEMSPDILLVDEVLGVGDIGFRAKSAATMKEKMKSGQTVVFVSHAAPTIRELCTRVAWIEDGVLRQVGDPDSVVDEYAVWMDANQRMSL